MIADPPNDAVTGAVDELQSVNNLFVQVGTGYDQMALCLSFCTDSELDDFEKLVLFLQHKGLQNEIVRLAGAFSECKKLERKLDHSTQNALKSANLVT